MKKLFILLIYFSFLGKILAQNSEMRGVWVATVSNIDFPSKPNLPAEALKREINDMLNFYQNVGINAIFFQARPACDAFYKSKIEPLSQFLVGKQRMAKNDDFDVLEYLIEQAHARNIELHAWLNPYRVSNSKKTSFDNFHIAKKQPNWVVEYAEKLYLDPGIPAVRHYVKEIVADIVSRYNVDGIHFDDYFYPYPERKQEFFDDASFDKYGKGMPVELKPNWRRKNVDSLIFLVHSEIKRLKPFVKFGVSPFGIWRNKTQDPDGSETNGFSAYDGIFADAQMWLMNGWVDYVAPQIYWNIGHKNADFEILVKWWKSHSYGKHVYVGMSVSSILTDKNNSAWQELSQIPNQIRISRKYNEVKGIILYSSRALVQNPNGVTDSLRDLFKTETAAPPMSWLDNIPPAAPISLQQTKVKNEIILSWEKGDTTSIPPQDSAVSFAVYRFKGEKPQKIEKNSLVTLTKNRYIHIRNKKWAIFKKKYVYVVTAFDKNGNESILSRPIVMKIK